MDKKMNLQGAGSFENLLLDLILENKKNEPEFQKSIDMTANALFSNTATIALPASAKKEFLSQFPSFTESWWTRVNIFRLFVGMVATVAVVLYFVAMNRPTEKQPVSSSALPIISECDSINRNETVPEMLVPKDAMLSHSGIDIQPTNLIDRKDTLTKLIPVGKESQFKARPTGPIPLEGDASGQRWSEINEEYNPFLNDGIEIKTSKYQPILRKYFIRQNETWPDYADQEKRKSKIIRSSEPPNQIPGGTLIGREVLDFPKSYLPYNICLYSGKPFDNAFKFMEFFTNENTEDLPYKALKSIRGELLPGNSKAIPLAMRFWKVGEMNENDEYIYDESRLEETCFQPFYFMKTEVSNQDYREFLYWVKKGNIAEAPGSNELHEDLPDEAYIYTFHNLENEYVKTTGKGTINIFPKKDVWTGDFKYANSKPLDDYYLSHPAYRDYPVVGVSYWQALAYLDWLTWIWQSRCDAQNIPYELEFDLPYDYEREWAVKRFLWENGKNIMENPTDFLCNLGTSYIDDYELRRQLNIYTSDQIYDSYTTRPVNEESILFENKSEILNLEGNVSEWCREGYAENYKAWREEYRELLKEDSTAASEILLNLDDYFNKACNNPKGKLVRGANWFDKRIRPNAIDLNDALWAKAFVDPNEQHSTVGFRAVLRVRLKNETRIKLKVKTLGRNMQKYDYSELNELPANLRFCHIKKIEQDSSGVKSTKIRNEKWDNSTTVTETTNLSWLFFLNYLIDENRIEDLNKCIPNNPDWAYKMSTETEPDVKFNKDIEISFLLPFPESFIKQNDLKKFPRTVFSDQPIVNISHEAAQLYCDWLNELYGHLPEIQELKFRLPSESEWESIANEYAGLSVYPWGGMYLRNSKGCFLANFDWYNPFDMAEFEKKKDVQSQLATKLDSMHLDSDTIQTYNDLVKNKEAFTKFILNQNKGQRSGNVSDDTYKLNLCGIYPSSENGLFDVSGNASEMISDFTRTKGGSYASLGYFLQIKNHEHWDGKPSPCVGFRVYLGKIK